MRYVFQVTVHSIWLKELVADMEKNHHSIRLEKHPNKTIMNIQSTIRIKRNRADHGLSTCFASRMNTYEHFFDAFIHIFHKLVKLDKHFSKEYSPLGTGTNQSGTKNNAKEILLGDIVMDRETEKVSHVCRGDDKLFLFLIDKAGKEELWKDELVVVSRPFFHGHQVCLVTDHLKLGIICRIDMRVDLASSDGKTIAYRDIGT